MFEIWLVSLLRPPPMLYLSVDEQARAARFHFDSDRHRYQRSHSALRLILGTTLNRDPLALSFASHPHGKPYPLDASLHFNLSHAGDLALCAIADHPVGVDVEHLRPIPDWRELASMLFSPPEQQALATASANQRDAVFLSLWTRKEALVKATGDGITDDLSAFSVPSILVSPLTYLATLTLPKSPHPYALFAFQPADGYLASVALQSITAALPTLYQF